MVHVVPLRFRTLAIAGLLACSSLDQSPQEIAAAGPPAPDGRKTITVNTTAAGLPIGPRLVGTNVPAWINPQNMANDSVRALTRALGPMLLRFPGGSWSNAYSWLDCEQGDANRCYWTWAARPTDMLNFAKATGNEASWTVSANGTSKEAAAVVAFFNGKVGDTTRIGVDIRGRDWKRVGDWAALRAAHGNPEPYRIQLWEVGNELYGSKPANGGPLCAPWGWEDTWTCDGTEYMNGKGVFPDVQEGYLAFRSAMRAVDPTILVGAVGVNKPGEWSDWGNKVIRIGGANLDFYVIHDYAFFAQPKGAIDVLPRAQQLWKPAIDATKKALVAVNGQRTVPIAVTEYNLASFQELDNGQLMTRAVNALFIADMVGQLAVNGVTIANQWNLANGRAGNGTDYGLIDVGLKERSPQYFAMKLWTSFGTSLLPTSSTFDAEKVLSHYAAKSADGSYRVMVINKTGAAINARVALAGMIQPVRVTSDVVAANSLDTKNVLFNGVFKPATDFSNAPSKALGTASGFFDHSFVAYSITVLKFTP